MGGGALRVVHRKMVHWMVVHWVDGAWGIVHRGVVQGGWCMEGDGANGGILLAQ